MNNLNVMCSPDVGLGVVGFPEVETVEVTVEVTVGVIACVVVVLPLRFQYSIGFHFSS